MLERAYILDDYNMIRLLLENAPNLQSLDCFDDYLLVQFYNEWNLELLKISLEKGASPNIIDEEFEEPLLWRAYIDKRTDVFSVLIQHGADHTSVNYLDETLMDLAQKEARFEIFKNLKKPPHIQ